MNKLMHWLSLPLYLWMMGKRNRKVRNILVWVALLVAGAWYLFGGAVVWTVFQLAARMAMGFFFVILQFVGIFWFMARSKAVEIHPGDDKTVTLADYWGNEHVVKAVEQWNLLLTDRGLFEQMGGRTISGLLLYGPPGTGKTMLAKAMAGSGGVAFYGVEGSSFRAMFMGVDILKMMAFFRKCRTLAKQYGACIGYLDEIDAVGMSRGGVMGQPQQHTDRGFYGVMMGMGGMGSGALTRLLYELDGLDDIPLRDQAENRVRRWFGVKEIDQGKVLIMGATNRPEVLDPALMRPGRLDKKIELGRPDRHSRRQMIEGYLSRINRDPAIDINSLVEDTPHATPAQIMSAITKDGVRRALFDGRQSVTQEDVELAFQDQVLGLANPIADLDHQQKFQIAVHEAGHAVASHYLNPHKRIVRVSIIRRSSALGYVMPVDRTDIYTMPLRHFVSDVQVAMAGHEATFLVLGEYWTGATGDLQAVRNRVAALAHLGHFGKYQLFDEKPGESLTKKIDAFMTEITAEVRLLLTEHRSELLLLANTLMQEEDLSGERVLALFEEAQNDTSDLQD